jgi:hypothetical protein
VSEATQQHSLALTLTNQSSVVCHLDGYPKIALMDAHGAVLPLTYRSGGDQMVTSSPPSVVNIPPDATAYVLANQTFCVGTDVDTAVSVRLTPPGESKSLAMSWGPYPIMSSCGADDPGSTLSVSPVEPTAQAIFSRSPT